MCEACYWGRPESYKHIALRVFRRLDVVWSEDEIEMYERLKERAERTRETMPGYVKSIIRKHLRKNSN